MPDRANNDWTPEMIQAEADAFLEECRKAAISIVRLNNMQLAADLLIDAVVFVGEYRRRLDEELFKDVSADMDLAGTTAAWEAAKRLRTSTIAAFKR